MSSQGTIERLLEVIRRSLKASQVSLLSPEQVPEGALCWSLPSGKVVAAHFDGPPDPLAAERLEALLSSFGGMLAEGGGKRELHADRRVSLVDELAQLAEAVGAVEVLVIDAHSPMVWGSSHGISSEELLGPKLRLVTADEPSSSLSQMARRAIRQVRSLPEIGELARGGYLRLSLVQEGMGLLARSFAGIYVLLLVYEGHFDELKTERCLQQALPLIERLVLGLPPPGPAEGGGAAARLRH
ncbi:MAG: hypothetical protein RMJ98_15140 [Myxococcales bacterium]|nr:hypothetical protein [Polyangiaceae bacterium]MDW8250628.1 hypothetical protein [Myxococcales bacterium]